jgi:cytidylate kinase
VGYLRGLYGRDPADLTLYHLVLDMATVSLDACLEAAVAAAVHP